MTAFGAIAFALGLTLHSALAWAAALVVAWFGYGVALERAMRMRQSFGVTIATGFAAVGTLSLAIAYLGCLVAPVQIALVAGGIAACWIDRVRAPLREPPALLAIAAALAAGAVLIAIASLAGDVPIADDANHGFLVKQLADTGRLEAVHRGSGLAIIGESYICIARGARDVALFEQALCPTLVLLVFAELCRQRSAVFAVAVVAIMGTSALLDAWSAIAILLACHVAWSRALEARRRGGHAILLALALSLLRHEYVLPAFAFVGAALALPRRPLPSLRSLPWLAAAWLVVAVALQLALFVSPLHALVDAVLLAPCFALFLLRRPVAALGCAALLVTGGAMLDAFRTAHDSVALVSVWVAFALAVVAEQPPGAALFAAASLLAGAIWPAVWDAEGNERVAHRFVRAIDALRFATPDEPALAALQQRAPAHARLGFWGRDATALDFRRNPIRDVSWPTASRRYHEYLMLLSRPTLANLDYVLVEWLPPSKLLDPYVADRWAANATGIDAVRGYLTLIEANGHGALYRISR